MSILRIWNEETGQWESVTSLKGDKGDTGVGISDIYFDEDNRLTLELDDGSSATSEPMTEKVNIDAFLVGFQKHVLLETDEDTVPLDMPGYVYDPTDQIFAFKDGLIGMDGIDYEITVTDNEAVIELIHPVESDASIYVRVLKARLDFRMFMDSDGNFIISNDGSCLVI